MIYKIETRDENPTPAYPMTVVFLSDGSYISMWPGVIEYDDELPIFVDSNSNSTIHSSELELEKENIRKYAELLER